jgi:hypothetical protein
VVSCSYCLLFGGPESYLIQQSSFRGEHYTNVYKARGSLIIKTRYCYHYAYGEDAIYDDEDKKIVWKDGDSPCAVEGIYK